MKTINIKGKEYVTVNERLKEFRNNGIYKGYSLESEVVFINAVNCAVKAIIRNEKGNVVATGLAHELKENPMSMVNKTNFVENCETSAWGRALANLGIGIDASVSSAEEVVNAVAKQTQESVGVSRFNEINKLRESTNLTDEDIKKILEDDFSSKKLKDLTEKEFKKLKQFFIAKQIINEVDL